MDLIALLLLHLGMILQVSAPHAGAHTCPISMYHAGDGSNHGTTACSTILEMDSWHVAMRQWHQYRCGRLVLLVTDAGRIAVAPVLDGGPYGIVDDAGGYKVWVKHRLPKGWRWRGGIDVTLAVHKALGSPRFLSKVHIYPLPIVLNHRILSTYRRFL